MKKGFIAVITLTAVILSGCGGGKQQIADTAENTVPSVKPVSNVRIEDKNEAAFFYCEYERLDGNEKALYSDICDMIEQKQSEFALSCDGDEIVRVYSAIIKDHPEYFWLGEGYSYSTTETDGIKSVLFKPVFADTVDIAQWEQELNNAAAAIISDAGKENDLIDRLIYVHDYLVENTDYDDATYGILESGAGIGKIYDASTSYGGIVGHKAVCAGYAVSFQLLAQGLGVPCGRVSGEKIGGGSHEWNYVILDGDYYYIDPTWDDPQSTDDVYKDIDNKSYDFFCITSDELLKTHLINDNQFIPDCTSTKFDYYIYNDLYLEKYDFVKVASIINNRTGNNASMKFANEAECQKALNDLFDKNAITQILQVTSLSYSIGAAGNTLTIYFN